MLWYKSILVPFTDFNVDNFAILSLAVVNIKYLKTLTDFYFLLSQKVGLFKWLWCQIQDCADTNRNLSLKWLLFLSPNVEYHMGKSIQKWTK